MPITDKTRKVVWGRSGNRCAVCRHELVAEATKADDESVIGDECHIVSGQAQGPRSDPQFPRDRLDTPENLILLCRVHHKMVDDQHETYSVELLQKLKANHEKWVSSALTESTRPHPVKLRRVKQNIPSHLLRLTSGRDVMSIVTGACASKVDHDELESEGEVKLVSMFLQKAQDWADLGPELGAGEGVRASFSLSELLKELEDAGFAVFGGREIQRLEGGACPPADFPVAILKVVRSTNPEITTMDLRGAGATGAKKEEE